MKILEGHKEWRPAFGRPNFLFSSSFSFDPYCDSPLTTHIIVVPPAIVEPIIALSIMFVAIENLLISELKPWRILIVFLFGLVHGLGFASALNEIGLPRNKFYTSIFSFNAGVELGQIAVIMMVFAILIIPFRKKVWYKKGIVYPLSVIIALIAAYWTITRLISI